MSIIEMPEEPKVDRLWTLDQQTGEPIEWKRTQDGRAWTEVGIGGRADWIDVLGAGPVYTRHPDIPAGIESPVRSAGAEVIDREEGGILQIDPLFRDLAPAIAEFVAQAINAHIQRLTETQSTNPG